MCLEGNELSPLIGYIPYDRRYDCQKCEYAHECPAYYSRENEPVQVRTVMTWAPSHPELGLLSELLSYANIINGLKPYERRKLRRKLEITYDLSKESKKIKEYMARGNKEQASKVTEKVIRAFPDYFADIGRKLPDKILLSGYKIGKGEKEINVFCVELCQEYIDYLKAVLKPYLGD